VTILLTLVGIALCFVWRRRGDVVHASEEPAAWWWRGDVPGRERAPAGTGADAESFDDDLEDDLDEEPEDERDLLDASDEAHVRADAISDDVFRDPGLALSEQPTETSEPTDRDR
jgi:hypothetical protein